MSSTPPHRRGPDPRWAVALELLRALWGVVLLPLHAFVFAFQRGTWRQGVRAALASQADTQRAFGDDDDGLDWSALPGPWFLSSAEPSGEIHALSFVRELESRGAAPQLIGFGGERSARAGVELVGDPVSQARMGLGVVGALPFYLRLLTAAARAFRERRPAVLVMIDSPALHIPLANIARRYGVRSVHFVTPQYWGWAPWRVRGYARAVDRALAILPFEPAWFREQGVDVEFVGHPLQDALARVDAIPADDRGHKLVLLCGSRGSVIDRNLPWMLPLALGLADREPGLEIVLPQSEERHAERIREHLRALDAEDRVRLEVGDLHQSLAGARAALSVSGTVLLDLLHHRIPTVVVYRLTSGVEAWLGRHALLVPYFSSINLLAGEEVCPEFSFLGDGPREAVAAALADLWRPGPAREACRAGLGRAAERLGPPGAVPRAVAAAARVALEGSPGAISGEFAETVKAPPGRE
ncbi:MAG: lipid-A-disaccharide synthase [Planctomycetota bacterium]